MTTHPRLGDQAEALTWEDLPCGCGERCSGHGDRLSEDQEASPGREWVIDVCRTCGRMATWPFCEHRPERAALTGAYVPWTEAVTVKEIIPNPARGAGGSVTTERVNHPSHYNGVPGIECIDVVEHFSFVRGNAIKYLWRAGAKGDLVEDLEKAKWYIQREIDTAKAASQSNRTEVNS